jgi:hypothetical protein
MTGCEQSRTNEELNGCACSWLRHRGFCYSTGRKDGLCTVGIYFSLSVFQPRLFTYQESSLHHNAKVLYRHRRKFTLRAGVLTDIDRYLCIW